MEGPVQYLCLNCGGDLQRLDGHSLKCRYCGSIFEDQSFMQKTVTLQEFLDQANILFVNNQRRNLYDAVCAKYISKNEVRQYATEIKKYLPDDFQANFYLNALSGDGKKMCELIRGIDAEENYELLPPIFRFLITSLESEFLLELNLLAERAYKNRDLALYSQTMTVISEEAAKVSAGVYETYIPRDVFIAYSSKDMDTVSKLCRELEEEGFSCFVAARNLRHGVGSVENYDNALKEAMDCCTCFLFVSSVNSRKFDCDAVRKEIPYIRSVDTRNAPPEYRYNYKTMPAKYKKPRIEYRIGTIVRSATNTVTSEFFDGYEWVYDTAGVIDRLMRILTAAPEEEPVYAPAPAAAPTPAPVPTPAPAKPKACEHVAVIDSAVEATCTEPGRTEGAHCSLCGEILKVSVPMAARGHAFGTWRVTKQATCTEDGEQSRFCACGEKETKTIPSFGGHRPGDWTTVKEPTEYEGGLRVRKCTVCGVRVASEPIPKKPMPKVTEQTAVPKATMSRQASQPSAPTAVPAVTPTAASASAQSCDVRLISCGKQKLVCAKLVSKTLGLALSDAMHLVESKTEPLAKGVSASEAERIRGIFEASGFAVQIEKGTSGEQTEARTEARTETRTETKVPVRTPNAIGGMTASSAPSASVSPAPSAQTCNVRLISYGNRKLTCAKLVQEALKVGLAQAMRLVESKAEPLAKGVSPSEAARIKGIFEANGFEVCIESAANAFLPNPSTVGTGAAKKASAGLAYQVSADRRTCTVTGMGTCKDKDLVIPEELGGCRVTSIGDSAFYGCNSLVSAEIPDSVTHMGKSVFCACEKLKRVTVGNAVTAIPDRAFHDCESLASVTVGDSVTVIGRWAFAGCAELKSLVVPASLAGIGESVFDGCDSLTDIRYKGTKQRWGSVRLHETWREYSSVRRIECEDGGIIAK